MIKFDSDYQVQDYTLILSRRNHEHLGQLRNVANVISKVNMNAANEIGFTIYKYNDYEPALFDGIRGEHKDMQAYQEPLWNEITDFKYVYVKELNEYYEIVVELNDEGTIYKSVTGMAACECELAQTNLYGLEINTELDIERDDYEPTVFYNPVKPDASLLHRTLYKTPHYSIKYVDESLKNIQRTFSADDVDVYSFFTNTVAEEIECLFVFDSTDRSISVYDLLTVCKDCGKRGHYSDICPDCESTALKYYGKDTTIYVDTENLAENITFTTDTDSVKNCFKLEAGDENMTAAVRNLNPNGSDYIYYFSDEQKHDMPFELVETLDSYDALVEDYREEYEQVIVDMYEAIDEIVYYTSAMMPTREDDPTNSELEAAKLTEEAMSPMGLAKLNKYTSTATVNTALKEYAKVFVKSGYYKIDINQGEFTYIGIKADGKTHYGYWNGNFKVTNYSDEEDFTVSEVIRVEINDDFTSFMEQKIKKKLIKEDEDGSIFNVLEIEDLDKFKEALTYYGLRRLTSFYDAIQGCLDIMIEMEQGNENALLYDDMYKPYYDKLIACQDEIDKRQATIDEWNTVLEETESRRNQIQKILDFEKYLGDDMYKVFCMYKRESKYSNSNYISDGFENDEIFQNAKTFLEVAKEELVKSGEHQHSISSNILNLMVMEEFAPLIDNFEVGNFIRIKVDGRLYRLRLTSYQIDFAEDGTAISVEFSDLTKVKNGATDFESIINKASSMASSYGYVTRQVKNSKDETDRVKHWVSAGLDTTEMKIVNNAENQNITIGDSGLLARKKDDFENVYEDCQVKLLSTGLYTTNDGWKTVNAAIGKSYTVNPETGEDMTVFGVNASAIVGDLILGHHLGIYSEDKSAQMSFDNNGLILNAIDDGDGTYKKILDIQKDGVSQLYVDTGGNVVLATDQIIETTDSIAALVDQFNSVDAKIDLLSPRVETLENDVGILKEEVAAWQDDGMIKNSIANITNVLSGNVGAGDLTQIHLNSNNTVVSNGMITDEMVSSTSPIQASKINFVDGAENKSVQGTLEEYKNTIAELTNLVATLQAQIVELQAKVNTLIEDGGNA